MDIEALKAPLDKRHVKTRDQSGTTLSYVMAWHAIAEANRIFGFDGWSRETLDMTCVSDRERKVGSGTGFGVAYTARVRITVGGVMRDGFGAGTQVDRDHGKAHEGASKEAESDATKRALMTFGNAFGLALYDKEQANVEDVAARQALIGKFIKRLATVETAAALNAAWAAVMANNPDVCASKSFKAAFDARMAELPGDAQ
jgi:DNA repair and recombination protein RAD52